MVLAIGMSAQHGVPHCIPARTGGLQQTYVHLKGSTEVQSRTGKNNQMVCSKNNALRCRDKAKKSIARYRTKPGRKWKYNWLKHAKSDVKAGNWSAMEKLQSAKHTNGNTARATTSTVTNATVQKNVGDRKLPINPFRAVWILGHVLHLLRPRQARWGSQAPQQHAGHLPQVVAKLGRVTELASRHKSYSNTRGRKYRQANPHGDTNS